MPDGDGLFIVTDLKQHAYCPRITYYERCLPDFRPRTYAMDAGQEAHQAEPGRAARRTLRAYGLSEGERHFEIEIRSTQLGLAGKIDEVVVVPGPPLTCYPIDYKGSNRVSPNHRLQVAAYALLLEVEWQAYVPQGYLYLLSRRRAEPVMLTEKLRAQLAATLEQVRDMTERERMPEPTTTHSRCSACEFRRTCNDV